MKKSNLALTETAVSARVDNAEIRGGVFAVEIPVAGRYRVEVSAKGDAALSLSDHIHNTDDRDYDITSAMPLRSPGAFAVVSRDGAPLNAGRHHMKLRVKEGAAEIEWIRFTLLRPHEFTPRRLRQNLAGDAWTLVWSDEFETDGPLDPETWTYDVGDWGWGNNEEQYYTDARLKNARCENGRMVVEARRDRADGGWTSARVTTRGRVSFLYGRIEVRARATAGDGNWPAIWLLGDSYRDELSWPYCGEVDFLESQGHEIDSTTGDGPAHFACHTRAYYFKQDNHITTSRRVAGFANAFHDYALEWTPAAIKIFFDGEHVFTYDKTADELEYPFNEPQNLVINMAMGGTLGRAIDPALNAERLEVEHIRVYERI